MILTKLKEYADTQMQLPPAMYNKRTVAWLISLTADGAFEGCICWKGSSKEHKKGISIDGPDRNRSGKTIRPKLLVDTFEYALGIGRPDISPVTVAEYHQQFKTVVKQCADATGEPSVLAVHTFLSTWEPLRDRSKLPSDIEPTEVVTFRVAGVVPADAKSQLTKVEQFWVLHLSGSDIQVETEEVTQTMMQCLITGELTEVKKRMPFFVKGLASIGGNPTGTALVSANEKVFTSYGLENSLTSPISQDAAEKFTKALNDLISSPDTHRNIGSKVCYVCWTKKPDDCDVLGMLDKPEPQAVQNLIDSPFSGQEVYGTDVNEFYALALSANNARAVVRDWLETTVPRVQENLKRWFRDQQITDAYGEPGKPLGIYALAASAYLDATKEMLPAVPTALVRTALQNIRLPDDLLTKLVRRNRAERKVTYPRAALIKLVLTTQKGATVMSEMSKLNRSPNLAGQDLQAYQCGRLLAELEALQRAAIGKVNASLTDRYYGSASSTPAIAFPPLMRNRQAHLSKLRKSKTGAFYAIDERIEEIVAVLPTFPKTLNMQQQGLFALGYYHQRADHRATAKASA
jgi:CRISPR-associated protein Csd1